MKLKITFATILLTVLTCSVNATETKVMSGSFTAENNTNHRVTLKVGNFFPTSYVIGAHSSTRVFVSSDNQNISIND